MEGGHTFGRRGGKRCFEVRQKDGEMGREQRQIEFQTEIECLDIQRDITYTPDSVETSALPRATCHRYLTINNKQPRLS